MDVVFTQLAQNCVRPHQNADSTPVFKCCGNIWSAASSVCPSDLSEIQQEEHPTACWMSALLSSVNYLSSVKHFAEHSLLSSRSQRMAWRSPRVNTFIRSSIQSKVNEARLAHSWPKVGITVLLVWAYVAVIKSCVLLSEICFHLKYA
jgi:hypothetical protein